MRSDGILHNAKAFLRKLRGPDEARPSPVQQGRVPYIFIHINKTGGTSVGKALRITRSGHLTAREIIDEIGREAWEGAYRFAFVRNPWDKVVSHYGYRVKSGQPEVVDTGMGFQEWVRRTYRERDPRFYRARMCQAQVEWIRDDRGRIDLDFIGRFERLAADFAHVCGVIGVEAELPHLKASDRSGTYRDYYDSETAEIVRACFAEDIERFDYEF